MNTDTQVHDEPLRNAVLESLRGGTSRHHLAAKLRDLAAQAHAGPWYAGELMEDEEDFQTVTVGPYPVEDRPAKCHYEDTILEVWQNPNLGGDALASARLAALLVSSLDELVQALEAPAPGCPWRPIAAAPVTASREEEPVRLIGWAPAHGAHATFGYREGREVRWVRSGPAGPEWWHPTLWVPVPEVSPETSA